MIEIIIGLSMTIVVEISKKINISTTYLIVGICIALGFVYTGLNMYKPDLLQSSIQFVGLSFASSQSFWMIYNKYLKNNTDTE